MLLRLKLVFLNIASTILFIFLLCLGSQNLDNRYKLNFLTNETVQLPIGFIVGVSFSLGFLSGGISSLLMTNNSKSK